MRPLLLIHFPFGRSEGWAVEGGVEEEWLAAAAAAAAAAASWVPPELACFGSGLNACEGIML